MRHARKPSPANRNSKTDTNSKQEDFLKTKMSYLVLFSAAEDNIICLFCMTHRENAENLPNHSLLDARYFFGKDVGSWGLGEGAAPA